MLGHKTSLNKFKKIEITLSIFPYYSGMKLEINSRGKAEKFTNLWKLNNTHLNNQWMKEEIKSENKKLPWDIQNGNTTYQNSWIQQKQFYEEIINKCLQ